MTLGNDILPSDLNQVIEVLQHSSGHNETGHYWLGGNAYSSSAFIQAGVQSISRASVPVSVTIDVADQAPTGNINGPTATGINSGGFHVFAGVSAITPNAYCGGVYTLQY